MYFSSLRKHPFFLALRLWGRCETCPAEKTVEKRMFSQASISFAFEVVEICDTFAFADEAHAARCKVHGFPVESWQNY